MSGWITVKEAADALGYSVGYFRRTFCNKETPLLTIRVIEGPTGGRRIKVKRIEVDHLIEGQTRSPK